MPANATPAEPDDVYMQQVLGRRRRNAPGCDSPGTGHESGARVHIQQLIHTAVNETALPPKAMRKECATATITDAAAVVRHLVLHIAVGATDASSDIGSDGFVGEHANLSYMLAYWVRGALKKHCQCGPTRRVALP